MIQNNVSRHGESKVSVGIAPREPQIPRGEARLQVEFST